jgi:putative membrane protein
MWVDLLLSYGHFIAAFIMIGAIAAEVFILRLAMRADLIRLIGRIDAFYGLAAVLVIGFGVARVIWGAKGLDFYLGQPFFWAKMGAILIAGLISIAPTLGFLRWNRLLRGDAGFAPEAGETRRFYRHALIQVHVLALAPLFAAMMARDVRF